MASPLSSRWIRVRKALRVGVWTQLLLTYLLPVTIRNLRRDGHNELIQVVEMAGGDLLTAVQDSTVDFAIASEVLPRRGLTATTLYMEDLVLGVPLDNPLAQADEIPLMNLHGKSIVSLHRSFPTRIALDLALASIGAQPVFLAELNMPETLKKFARQAKLPIVAPASAFHDSQDFKVVRLVDPTPVRAMMLIVRDGEQLSPAAVRLVAALRDAWQSLR